MHNASECWTTVSRTAGRRAAAASAAARAPGSATRFTRTPPWGRINSSPIIGRDSFPRKHETHEITKLTKLTKLTRPRKFTEPRKPTKLVEDRHLVGRVGSPAESVVAPEWEA